MVGQLVLFTVYFIIHCARRGETDNALDYITLLYSLPFGDFWHFP